MRLLNAFREKPGQLKECLESFGASAHAGDIIIKEVQLWEEGKNNNDFKEHDAFCEEMRLNFAKVLAESACEVVPKTIEDSNRVELELKLNRSILLTQQRLEKLNNNLNTGSIDPVIWDAVRNYMIEQVYTRMEILRKDHQDINGKKTSGELENNRSLAAPLVKKLEMKSKQLIKFIRSVLGRLADGKKKKKNSFSISEIGQVKSYEMVSSNQGSQSKESATMDLTKLSAPINKGTSRPAQNRSVQSIESITTGIQLNRALRGFMAGMK